jgi:hypothetical protein
MMGDQRSAWSAAALCKGGQAGGSKGGNISYNVFMIVRLMQRAKTWYLLSALGV